MPNVNPPQDRKEAIEDPLIKLYGVPRDYEMRIGPAKTADTLPEPGQFRYAAMITPAGDIWSGYLWREDGTDQPGIHGRTSTGEGVPGTG